MTIARAVETRSQAELEFEQTRAQGSTSEGRCALAAQTIPRPSEENAKVC
jgi:hypothetical protein